MSSPNHRGGPLSKIYSIPPFRGGAINLLSFDRPQTYKSLATRCHGHPVFAAQAYDIKDFVVLVGLAVFLHLVYI